MSKGIKILLVEDNPLDVALFKELLAETSAIDFSVRCVDDLKSAISCLGEEEFDIVFLDLYLPDSSGLSAFTKLHARAPEVPVIILTGMNDEVVAIKTVKEGAQDYLVKGKVDGDMIVRAIRYAIERTKSARCTRESEAKYKTLFDSACDAIFLCRLEGDELRFVECNPYSLILFKCSHEDIIGKSPLDFSPRSQPDGAFSEIKYAEKVASAVENIPQHFIWKHCQNNGTPFDAEVSLSHIELNGKPYLQSIVRDISERMEIDRMKTEFLSVASHELRTPMASINNVVSMIIEGKAGEINSEQKKFLVMAERNVKRLSTLTNKLLDITRIESRKMNFNYSEIDVSNSIENVINTLKPLAETKSITLRTGISDNLPGVYADCYRIEEVLINLVGNAIKFTPGEGEIAIRADLLTSPARIGPDNYIEISVSDTGIGIPGEHMKYIFDKFYQVDNSLQRHYESTGLGLAICKGIVEAHGGEIRCLSDDGKGCTFTFTLPATVMTDEFNSLMHSELMGAIEKNYNISILLFRIRDFDGTTKKGLIKTVESLLAGVCGAFRRKGLRATDRLHLHMAKGEIILVARNADRDAAKRIYKKMLDTISETRVEGHDDNLQFFFLGGSATYPGDGGTIEELLEAARHTERPLVR